MLSFIHFIILYIYVLFLTLFCFFLNKCKTFVYMSSNFAWIISHLIYLFVRCVTRASRRGRDDVTSDAACSRAGQAFIFVWQTEPSAVEATDSLYGPASKIKTGKKATRPLLQDRRWTTASGQWSLQVRLLLNLVLLISVGEVNIGAKWRKSCGHDSC